MWIRYAVAYIILISTTLLCGTYIFFLWFVRSWIPVIAEVFVTSVCVLIIGGSVLLLLYLGKRLFRKEVHEIGEYGSVVQGFFKTWEVRPLQPKMKQQIEQRQPRMITELSGIFPPPGEFTELEGMYRRETLSRNSGNEGGNERASLSDYIQGLLPQEGSFQGSGNGNEAILEAYEQAMTEKGKAVKSLIAKELGMTGRKYIQFCQQWKELGLE